MVIAKLDRLGHDLAFIATLVESGVDFVAADTPQTNRLTSVEGGKPLRLKRAVRVRHEAPTSRENHCSPGSDPAGDPLSQPRCRAGATFSIALSLTNSLALSLAKLFGSVRLFRPVPQV